jgi:hypothetical protein
MKRILLFSMLLILETYAQSDYTVELNRTYCWWLSRENWLSAVEAVIKYNGNPIPNSNNYFYEYHLLNPDGSWELNNSGFGMNTAESDGTQYQTGTNDPYTQLWYVIVSDLINHTFTGITSDMVSFQLTGTPDFFQFHAEDKYGNTISGINGEHWMYPVNLWAPNFNSWLTLNHTEVLKSSPNVSANKKFWHWGDNVSDISNYNFIYFIDNTNNTIKSVYDNNYGSVQINSLVEGYDFKVAFKDPWLVDETNPAYYTEPYGFHNLGMGAPYDTSASPFYLTLQSKYKGVLLNRPYTGNNPVYYTISIPSSINLPNNEGTHNLYLQSWDVSGASLQHPNSLTTGVVFTSTGGATITANVKAQGLSNDQNAFSKNDQRKIVQTPDGTLHMVYQSMGHIFYEASGDNGQTWVLMNNGLPLDNNGGESPSLSWISINGESPIYVVIVFKQTESGSPFRFSIQAVVYSSMWVANNPSSFSKKQQETIYVAEGMGSYFDAEPVIVLTPAVDCAGVYIMWHTPSSLLIQRGGLSRYPNNNPLTLIGNNFSVPGTGLYSVHPSIAAANSTWPTYIGLTWQENNQIKYTTYNGSTFGNVVTLSTGDGFSGNANPSLVVLSDGLGRICWKGSYCAYYEDEPNAQQIPSCYSKVVFKGTNNSRFWIFGNNTGSPNINKSDVENYYAIVWGSSDGSSTYFTDNSLGTPKEIGIPGKDIQVSNGPSKDQMYAEIFNTQSTPYYFVTSNNIGSYYSLHKETDYTFSSGREGVIYSDTAQFFFTVGDVSVDDQPINFIEIPDSLDVNTKILMNEYLRSETFQLMDNSAFLYSVEYGIADSLAVVSLLGNSNKFISFKLELVDAQSSEILDSFDEVTYDQLNMPQYNNYNYQVNTQGIGNRTVYLRLKVDNNFDPNYSLGELYAIGNTLMKSTVKIRNYNGEEVVKDYNLFQNFPNPFNPTTTIKYQILKDGMVILKVYDILGAEVATLINEEKTTGRYEVNFDASKLSSGVYIYQLNVNDYVSVKKMVLIK